MAVLTFRPCTNISCALAWPHGQAAAVSAAAQELTDFINEMPDGFYHMVPADCDLAAERVIARYLHVLKTQHAAATD